MFLPNCVLQVLLPSLFLISHTHTCHYFTHCPLSLPNHHLQIPFSFTHINTRLIAVHSCPLLSNHLLQFSFLLSLFTASFTLPSTTFCTLTLLFSFPHNLLIFLEVKFLFQCNSLCSLLPFHIILKNHFSFPKFSFFGFFIFSYLFLTCADTPCLTFIFSFFLCSTLHFILLSTLVLPLVSLVCFFFPLKIACLDPSFPSTLIFNVFSFVKFPLTLTLSFVCVCFLYPVFLLLPSLLEKAVFKFHLFPNHIFILSCIKICF